MDGRVKGEIGGRENEWTADKRSGGWANGRTDDREYERTAGRYSSCLRTECKPVGG